MTLKNANRGYGIQFLICVFSLKTGGDLRASGVEAELIQHHQEGEMVDHVHRPPRTGFRQPTLLRRTCEHVQCAHFAACCWCGRTDVEKRPSPKLQKGSGADVWTAGRGAQNGGVEPPLQLKSDEINQGSLDMGTEAQRTTRWPIWSVVTTVADKMVW